MTSNSPMHGIYTGSVHVMNTNLTLRSIIDSLNSNECVIIIMIARIKESLFEKLIIQMGLEKYTGS
jgi:hypothetical protein